MPQLRTDALIFGLYRRLPVPSWLVKMASWFTAPKYRIGVLGVILNDEREVLLVSHTYRGKYPWALPGGIVKRHEDPRSAIVREIKEEMGVEVVVDDIIDVRLAPRSIYVDVFFLCRIIGNASAGFSTELAAAHFYRRRTLPRDQIHPGHLRALEDLLNMLDIP